LNYTSCRSRIAPRSPETARGPGYGIGAHCVLLQLNDQRYNVGPQARRWQSFHFPVCSQSVVLPCLSTPMSGYELFYSGNSPYVRKTLVAARVLGLRDSLKLIPTAPAPVKDVAELNPFNPLAKIPSLKTPNNGTIFDSSVIVQYFDAISKDAKVLPPATDLKRYEALAYEALTDGALDALLLIRYETTLNPPEQRHEAWIEGQFGKAKRAITQLGTKLPLPDVSGKSLPLQAICLAVLLWYLDRRFPDAGWRTWEGGEALDKWYKVAEKNPSWEEEVAPPL